MYIYVCIYTYVYIFAGPSAQSVIDQRCPSTLFLQPPLSPRGPSALVTSRLGVGPGRFEDPQGPLGKLRRSLFLLHVPANNHFSAILEKHEYPYVDFRISMKIIENH